MSGEATVTVPVTVSKYRIGCLLCSAFEGGSNYWCQLDLERSTKPPSVDFEAFKGDDVLAGPKVYPHIHWPLSEGGSVACRDLDLGPKGRSPIKRLDLDACKRGLVVMAEKYPRHFADFIAENDDAETGDVFLQCCLFGEAIYG